MCSALLGGSGTFEMRACAAVQAGTTTRLTGYRSYRQRSGACNALRMNRCDRLPPPPSAATGKATPYGGEECLVGNACTDIKTLTLKAPERYRTSSSRTLFPCGSLGLVAPSSSAATNPGGRQFNEGALTEYP